MIYAPTITASVTVTPATVVAVVTVPGIVIFTGVVPVVPYPLSSTGYQRRRTTTGYVNDGAVTRGYSKPSRSDGYDSPTDTESMVARRRTEGYG